MTDLLSIQHHPTGINTVEDVEHYFLWSSRFDDIHDKLGLADAPLHRPWKLIMPQLIQPNEILKPSQGKLACDVVVHGRYPLNSVDYRPLFVVVGGNVENGYGNAKKQGFYEAALARRFPDTAQALKVRCQINFGVVDTGNKLFQEDIGGANLNLLRIERLCDFSLLRIILFNFKSAVIVGFMILPRSRSPGLAWFQSGILWDPLLGALS